MKQFTKIATAIAAFALSGMANAGLISVTYTGQGASSVIDSTHPYTVNFDLTQGTNPYRPLIDTVGSADVKFSFKDTGAASNESFAINIGSVLIGSSNGVIDIPRNGTNYGPFSITGVSLSDLSTSGKLSLVISAPVGDFNFVSSTLDANVTVGTVPTKVPEPLSVALLGIGFAGLAVSRRKARKA
ncbi:PEP-CTERM sorting domain-containing protein [Massilia sp. LXY-6]|uniref:PEP-CTERM sorting domain-containing protein n=1 Tax=Massilia sp. LXY-6 TaxID=3379823 RepID=UPI003EDE84B9